jgi:ubiquinone biosynthesis protein
MGLWVMALLISSSIICTTDMKPQLLGIPALGFFGYVLAFAICLYIFIRHFLTRNK